MTERPPTRARRAPQGLYPNVLLIPMLLMLLGVFVLPMGWFFIQAFRDVPGGFNAVINQAYKVLTSRAVEHVLILTNLISLVVTVAALLIAYPIAYVLAKARGVAFTLIIMSVVIPYFTSIIVRTYSWMVLLGRNGLINHLLLDTGLIDKPMHLMYNKFGVVVGMTYILLPYMVMTLFSVMRGIDSNLIRAARGMGATSAYAFWKIYFPLSVPGVLSGSLIVFILAIGFFVTPALMGGPSDVMIAMLIQRQVELTLNWSLAAIMSLLLLAVTLILYSIYYRFTNVERMLG